SIWQNFAVSIPEKGKVVDLATGDGRVLAWIGAERGDLDHEGIDLAPNLPPSPPGTTTRGGIAMEDLPFDDGSVAAVTSQFGFEYGSIPLVVKEIARILAPGGTVGLMMHRGDGPILKYNTLRREQLEWALSDRAIVSRTRASIGDGTNFAAALPYAAETAEKGMELYGQTSPAWEISEAVRRTLLMGERAGRGFVLDTLGAIESQAGNEIGRIRALMRACAVADDRGPIIDTFETCGIELANTTAVEDEAGLPFADFLALAKA
ncbi:MAG: class I SAM-dependent methyltransferase, partial [Erythrobacter sp.]|nr:class I SAM-dependent methyltransferase [Erythrobacter sp.]